jgi:hypothetical protein
LACEYGSLDTLAEEYRYAVWRTIARSLDFLQHEPRQVPLPPMPSGMPTVDGVFSLDADKALYVSLTTDDFREYDRDQVLGTWKCPELSEQIEERQKTVEQFLVQSSSRLNEIIVLHLLAGIGRGYSLGIGSPPAPLESPTLFMSASDFEVVALLESGNPMVLRQYARASTRVRDHTRVFAWSELDEFSLYRGNQYSYYFSDETRPTAITISPGSGLNLRLQVIKEFDRHAVPAFESGRLIEVVRIERNYDIPIYGSIELARMRQRFALVVEDLPVHVWIIGPDFEEEPEQHQLAQVYLQVVDMIAYWLWQFSPVLVSLLSPTRERAPTLVVKLRANPSQDWLERGEPAEQDGHPIAQYELLEGQNSIVLHLEPSLQRALERPDNYGERALMVIVLDALDELSAGSTGGRQLAPPDVREILDEYAPLGRKKKALVLAPHKNPALSTQGLPRHRNVQMADKSVLLDEIGIFLIDNLGMSVGPIHTKEDRTRVLGQVVGFLYQRLRGLVSTLSPRFLLDWLVRYHEAIRYDMAHLRLTMPTRLACFWSTGGFASTVTEELQDLYEAAQSARFVIEYVAAQPPHGLRPMSWSVYDELQALATEIILWAGISDLIHYGIADIELAVLSSGRLGSSYHTVVDQAGDTFLPLHSSERIDRAVDLFERHWPEADSSPKRPPAEVEEIDNAFTAEFGYSLTELNTLMTNLFVLGTEQESHVKRLGVDNAIARLSESTGFPTSRVNRILNDLTLESREDFLRPPPPFQREDVYPWRFGRTLSYIRRPLILATEDEGSIFVWGNLHLNDSRGYIVDLCLGGRLHVLIAHSGRKSFRNSVFRNFFRLPSVKLGDRWACK